MNNNGTFVAVTFDENTNRILHEYALTNGIPNPMDPIEYHSTIVYSRKALSIVEPERMLNPNWIGVPLAFDVYEGTFDGKVTNCLVLKYHCVEVNYYHEYLRTFGGATHDFPTYNSHITLSNDIGDFDIQRLRDIGSVLRKIVIVREYSEELKDVGSIGSKKDT